MNIYEYCTTEKTAFQTRGVSVAGNWEWKMYDHINYSLLMKNSQFPMTQTVMGERPMKNIIRPILNVAYRSEGFDVKDIEPFVNDEENYYLSLLVRKFHNKWARKNDLDTFIDELVENYIDYGGVLVKNVNSVRPEVVAWQSIAFCDQTDIISGTIAIKHQYSIDQLVTTAQDLGWDMDVVNTAVEEARDSKKNDQSLGNEPKVPDKHIEVFELHGTFPQTWLAKDGEQYQSYNEKLDSTKYSKQIHLITYTKSKGLCLFKGLEKASIFKFLARDKVYGRALGFGGIEELFESQIWTNNNMIHMQKMLAQASKIIYQSADAAYTTKNNTRNADNGDVFIHEDGKPATLLNNQALNLPLFERAVADWEVHARTTGSAQDAQLGNDPVSGTPFALQNLVIQTGQSLHKYRQGKIATFLGEIYRDWILQYLVDEMNKGDKWIDEFSLDEMKELSENVMNNAFNDYIKKSILSGVAVNPSQLDQQKQQFIQDFNKSNKKFLEIFKGEIDDILVEVEVNIAGKQKDLSGMTNKLTEIFKTIFANPQGFIQTMQIPGAVKAFNDMLESSGLKQYDFSMPSSAMQPQPGAVASPLQPSNLPVAANQ